LGKLECGGSSKKVTIGFWLIWHITIWVLWKRINVKIFKGINFEMEELVVGKNAVFFMNGVAI